MGLIKDVTLEHIHDYALILYLFFYVSMYFSFSFFSIGNIDSVTAEKREYYAKRGMYRYPDKQTFIIRNNACSYCIIRKPERSITNGGN